MNIRKTIETLLDVKSEMLDIDLKGGDYLGKKVELVFKKERETKRTVRYEEVSDNPVIGLLYVKKFWLGEPYPKKLKVTLEVVE